MPLSSEVKAQRHKYSLLDFGPETDVPQEYKVKNQVNASVQLQSSCPLLKGYKELV